MRTFSIAVVIVAVVSALGCTSDKTAKPVTISKPGKPDVPDVSEIETKKKDDNGFSIPGQDGSYGQGNDNTNDNSDQGDLNSGNGTDPGSTNNSGNNSSTGSNNGNSNSNTNTNNDDAALIGTWDGASDVGSGELLVINRKLPETAGNTNTNTNTNDNSNSNDNSNDNSNSNSNDNSNSNSNSNDNSNSNGNTGAGVTYVKDIAPIMTRLCVSCHTPRGRRSTSPLTNYQQVFAYKEAVVSRTDSGNMPTTPGKATPAEKALLKQWRDAGYPEGN